MRVVKAFVGHSFTESDKTLNSSFFDYLTQIERMGVGFTWDHAKAAEPRELAEKVMDLIRDKNLFIGICTKKELVISPVDIERCGIMRKMFKGDQNKFIWKTSDWIIQEIGLAIGREMDLLLLVEEGLRPSGGLQGNIEYIEFSREYPERSFGKILEMIQSLMPKAGSMFVQDLETASPENTINKQKLKENSRWWFEPKPEWSFNYYLFALRQSIKEDDYEAEEKITASFMSSTDGCSPNGPLTWSAYTQYYHLFFGQKGSLENLEKLATENPDIDKVQKVLGKAYEIYKEYGKAGHAYLLAAEKTKDVESKLNYLSMATEAYSCGGMNSKLETIVEQMRQELFLSGKGEKILASTLKKVANTDSDMDSFYGLSERLLELNPGDNDTRFQLAYKYSQSGEDKLSLFHYLRIPEAERQGGTWNNLGAQYDELQIVGCSVNSYREAEKVGETLAMSNIANKFIQAGFLKEAEEICDKALEIKDYNRNISHWMVRIKEIPDEEAKKEAAILKEAVPYSDFYKDYGKALCKSHPTNCDGTWEGPKCHLSLMIHGCDFHAEGTFEHPSGNRLGILGSFGPIGGIRNMDKPSSKMILKYVGTISGHCIKALLTENPESDESVSSPNTILSDLPSAKTERSVLMVISDTSDEIRVYDKKAPVSHRFYTLKRLKINKND